ncbi:MAG: glycosyltransferase [Methanobacteriota archaeon]|nr:MAG: glycosyltransferase [Euryarchaeota archaeon]
MDSIDIAVVISVKDDPRVVECVDAVLAQTAPFPFEVVVVDNGSRDDTLRLLSSRFQTNPSVKLLAQKGHLSEAWNTAAQTTTVSLLVRIDADARPLPGWLDALTRPIREGTADWTAGPVGGANVDVSIVARYYHERTEAYNRRLARDADLRDAVPSWNVAYRRSALERAGWYDPWQASSVDWDLHKRLARTGARGQFVKEARCVHYHPTRLWDLARKEAWYRTGQYQMALKYGFLEMASGFSLPLAYGLLLALAIAALALTPLAWTALLLLVALLLKHWVEGVRESDPMWFYRALFRPVEGFAGLYGLVRGLVRYGVRRPVPP